MAKKNKGKKGKKREIEVTSPDDIPVTKRVISRVEPDEWYKAEFTEADVGKGQYGPWIRLDFELKAGRFEDGRKCKGWKAAVFTNAEIAEGTFLFKIVSTMKGKDPKLGKKIDLTVYYGNLYLVFIEDKVAKRGKNKGETRQTITKIKRYKKKKK